ncbi:MAG: HD domain-containing protein [Oscillospiraceae bacterium]|jgi:metal-dependent HD superfamily phosphatase/phosphodiesterase|nr:HD domain-containing protein [Oscillospiraceae bacterium]
MITFQQIKQDSQILTYIQKADETLAALGYTEHSLAHVGRVAETAGRLLAELGHPPREAELARIAGYLHDIGNIVNRVDHAQSGAVMAFRLLDNMGMDAAEIAAVVSAIGNHDESTAFPVNAIAAALILGDKTDVRRSRVRNQDFASFDIHDRVNYAVTGASAALNGKDFVLKIDVDTSISPVLDYFEIFMDRMLLCRRAADKLGLQFRLVVNNQTVL